MNNINPSFYNPASSGSLTQENRFQAGHQKTVRDYLYTAEDNRSFSLLDVVRSTIPTSPENLREPGRQLSDHAPQEWHASQSGSSIFPKPPKPPEVFLSRTRSASRKLKSSVKEQYKLEKTKNDDNDRIDNSDNTPSSILKHVDSSFKKTMEYTQQVASSDEFKAVVNGATTVAAYGTATVAGALAGGFSSAISGGSHWYQWGTTLLKPEVSTQDRSGRDLKQQIAYEILTGAASLALGAVGTVVGFGLGAIGGAVNGFQNYQASQALYPAIQQSFSSAFQACASARLGAGTGMNSSSTLNYPGIFRGDPSPI